VAGPPVLDRSKSLEPVARDLEQLAPLDAPLCALSPSETLRGVIAFYTDRSLCIVPDLPELIELTADRDVPWLLVENNTRRFELDQLRRAGIPYRLRGTLGSGERAVMMLWVGSRRGESGAEVVPQVPGAGADEPAGLAARG